MELGSFLIFEKNNSGATSLQEVFISSIFTFPELILQFFLFVFQESNMVGLQANTLGAGTWLEGWHFNQGPNCLPERTETESELT